jgi:iron complex outermembrane receptor protein
VAQQNAAALAAGQPAPFPNAGGYRAVFPYSKDLVGFANFDCGATTPAQFAAAGTNTPVGSVPNFFVTRCGARKFKYWTYRLAADYQITPDNMVYASYSTGVHSGGFGASFTPSTIPQGTFATFDAERVRAIEIGSKNSFLDRRLQVNAAVFYNKYTDNQVQGTQVITTGPNTSVGVATIANVGNTEAPGAELSIIAKPVRRLTLRAAGTYLRARNSVAPLGIFGSGLCTISTGPTSPCGAPGSPERIRNQAGLGSGFFPNPQTNPELFVPITNAAGAIIGYSSLFFGEKTRVQNTPDWSANFGASYEIPLAGGATLTPEADVIYSGKYLLSAAAPNFMQNAYAKIDLRLTYRTEDGLSLQAYVQNVTNKATLGRITTGTLSAQGTYSDPRTYGLRLGYRF